MSMICFVMGLSRNQIDAVRSAPSLTKALSRVAYDERFKAHLSPAERAAAEARDRAVVERTPDGDEWEHQVAGARAKLASFGPLEPSLDLGKSWHMLHYLFTGHMDASKAPGDALLTGAEVGESLGYGPARWHTAEESAEFARFLKTQDVGRLQQRVNYRQMSDLGVYAMPMGPGSPEEYERELREEVAFYFPRLKDYVGAMAGKGKGLLIFLS